MSDITTILTTTITILFNSSISLADETINNSLATNVTVVPPTSDTNVPLWVGFIGCLIASVFFGSNFVPVKQYSAGDGFFFQFVFCVSVWIVGLILDVILDNQRFYPLVLIGGVLWATGNLVTVFCIKTCGLTVGLLIWCTSCLIMGWASGRFGIFGINAQVPSTSLKLTLNYASVILAATSAIFFVLIKSNNTSKESITSYKPNEQATVEIEKKADFNEDTTEIATETDFPFLVHLSAPIQKALGCVLALMAGAFYGLMFIPDQYIRDHPEKFLYKGERPPLNGLYYINSQYSGILLSSTFYFIVYALLKRNKPTINPTITLPAMVSGSMWAIANIGFILGISSLKGAVAYPIVAILPGVVTSLWSLFWFREIVGKKNYIYLGCGMFLRCLAALLSGLSA
ncbi:unnamed protein product [Rotaria magnacalcarata]|uniref:Transmembrane protein 144 n=1 Tax=Rotaria magnacalcarata TaxID=392030 RepID=A0A820ASE8_9BILA|nr:unnamed protein product [Rotaria magnacalcarata]CAF1558566.1 unnamed protein product [Rotaria magnacalcarata]CAF2117269.1 unnamed protein product [Rotaria magnacalcarata]CAF2121970.1 unnamed protein product [Rotaria magnacalcarata]CAF3846748.1 unnamed protein product [Rotaria magnacalcarata]